MQTNSNYLSMHKEFGIENWSNLISSNKVTSNGGVAMSSQFEQNLNKYAEVIVKVGLNLQAGQRLLIGMPFYEYLGTPIEFAPFVRRIVKEAY